MLRAVLGVLHPSLTETMMLRRKSEPHAALCTSLAWAWSAKSGFRNLMDGRDMPPSLKRQRKSKGIGSEWSELGIRAWTKICRQAVKDAPKQSKFDVEIVFGGYSGIDTGGTDRPSARNRATQVAKKQSARKHRRIQDSVMLLQAIFSIGEYSSYAAYERAREVFFEKYGHDRKRKRRGSAAGRAPVSEHLRLPGGLGRPPR